jgi:photosystem II stability/assembly factor-like uncharacterized protein
MRSFAGLLMLAGCQSCGFHSSPDDLAMDLSLPADAVGGERAKPATHLIFMTPPHGAQVDFPIGPVVVAALDEDGNVAPDFAGTVKVYVTSNALDVTLRGAVLQTAQAGLAHFDDLSIDGAAAGLSLAANSRSVGAAASPLFDVSAAAWSPGNTGLDAGEVLRLFVDPTDPTKLALATSGAGVFTSVDSGVSWRTANLDLGDHRVRDLAMDGGGTLYAATASGLYQLLHGNPSWNTLDLGAAWRGQPVTAVAAHLSTLYAAVGGRLLSSSDAGSTWTALPANPDTAAALRLAVAPDDDQLLFASDGATVVKSTDGGAHFARWVTGLGAAGARDLAFDASGNLYAATGGGSYRLPKDGTQWSPLGGGPTAAVAAAGSDVYFGGDDGLVRWNSAGGLGPPAPPPHPDPSAVAISPTFVYLGTRGGGVFRWDGGTWLPGKGLSAARVTGLAAVAAGTLVCATSGGLFRSTDQASTWSLVLAGSEPRFDFITLAGDLFALARGTAWRSSDGGVNFVAAPGFDGCSSLVFDPADATVAWCPPSDPAVNGIYRITMDGVSRMLLQNGLGAHVTSAAAADSMTVWAATPAGLFRTVNAGASWSSVMSGSILAVASPGPLLVSTDSGAVSSGDGGASFQPLDANLAGTRHFFANAAGGLYAAAEKLWRSTDGGATWTRADSGLNGTPVTALAFDPGAALLVYAGSDGAGLFRSTSGGQ